MTVDLGEQPNPEHIFVLVEEDGGVTAGCTCGWFSEVPMLDENNARAEHFLHQGSA